MKKKGLCGRCIHDKECDYPRKFPVHACDDFTPLEVSHNVSNITGIVKNHVHKKLLTGFTPSKNNNYEEIQKWSEKE